MSPPRARSPYLRLAPGLLCVGLLFLACWRDASDPEQASRERAWSVQLHVHGSFSEGMGSIDSHSFEADALGVDAIWWSDHDFRITSYRHVDRFGFEGATEPIDAGEDWSVRLRRFADDQKTLTPLDPGLLGREGGGALRFVEDPVREGARSLLLEVEGDGDALRQNACLLSASRKLHRRPLAGGLSLRLWVYPRALGADARPFVQVLLSEHAPREDLDLEQISLRYELSPAAGEPRRDGSTLHVPVRAEEGRWNELVLPVSADAARGFPFLAPGDDALYRLIVGVEARGGARAEAAFDALSFEHDRRGPEMFGVQREVLGRVAPRYPELRQFQGVEISFASRHLNEFSLAPELPDYDALAAQVERDADDGRLLDEPAFRRAVTRQAVEGAHVRGGLVSYNHLFGTAPEGSSERRTPEEQLAMMVRNRGFGVDILEVGYRDRGGASLADHLWVWDRMAEAGLRPVGTGVSDSHGGPDERWSGRPNNFVSWIWAPELEQAALLEGLRAGRVVFGDIELWQGTLDLATDAGHGMGSEVVTDRARLPVELRVGAAAAGDVLLVVEGGRERGRHVLAAGDQVLAHTVELPPDASVLLRVEVHDSRGAKALSNPIHFLRPERVAAGAPLAPARGALDLAGIVARAGRGLWIEAVEPAGDGLVRLRVRATAGTLRVAPRPDRTTDATRAIRAVRLEGLAGRAQARDGAWFVEDLQGSGTIDVHLGSG